MPTEHRIVLADDHPIVRSGLRQAIENGDPTLKVVAEADDGRAALALVERHRPRIAVLDIDMPGLDGLDVARRVREKNLAVEIIFLTIHRDEDLLDEAIDLGVKGYILKDSALYDIIAGIKAVLAGESYTSPAMTTYLLGRRRRTSALAEGKRATQSLTPTERRVLSLVAEYKTTKEIADELSVSPRTVETHRTNICQKLDLHGNHALIKFALAHKFQMS